MGRCEGWDGMGWDGYGAGHTAIGIASVEGEAIYVCRGRGGGLAGNASAVGIFVYEF